MSLGTIATAMAGLKDSNKVIEAKLSALMGNQEGVSTLNAVNMLGWTGRGYEQGLAEAIWEDELNVKYADLDEAYGEYKIGEDGITISKTMLGGGKEGSAKPAAVMSHEGVHALKGIRIEALAHLQGNSTYNAINTIFGLTADKEFLQGMISAIMNPESWVENTRDVDLWYIKKGVNGEILGVWDDGNYNHVTVEEYDGTKKITRLNFKDGSISKALVDAFGENMTKEKMEKAMIASGLKYEGGKGWYAAIPEASYKRPEFSWADIYRYIGVNPYAKEIQPGADMNSVSKCQ
jgi:hypothetical protein